MVLPQPKHEFKPPTWPQGGTNARTLVRDEAFSDLVASIRQNGVLQPAGALETAELIFGFRRVAAAIEAGLELMPFHIYPNTLTPTQVRVINLTENIDRVGLRDPELHLAAAELMALNPDWTRKELAAHLGKSQSTVTHWLCPDDLIPEARQAFLDGKFGFTKAYAISKLKPEKQGGLLALTLKGTTRDELERHGRMSRNQPDPNAEPPEKTARVQIPLATDVATGKVTVAGAPGAEIDLEGAETLLKEALKAVRSAKEKSLSIKSAQGVWRDMAAG